MKEVKSDVKKLKSDMEEVKSDIQELKTDVQELKSDMVEVKNDVQELKTDVQGLKQLLNSQGTSICFYRRGAGKLELNLDDLANCSNGREVLAAARQAAEERGIASFRPGDDQTEQDLLEGRKQFEYSLNGVGYIEDEFNGLAIEELFEINLARNTTVSNITISIVTVL